MLVKIHNTYRMVVAICDTNLVGKKFEEGERQLDLTGNFFKGEEKTEEEIKKIIKDLKIEDASFNIVGKDSCRLAKEIGLINEEGINKIQGVPVAMVLM